MEQEVNVINSGSATTATGESELKTAATAKLNRSSHARWRSQEMAIGINTNTDLKQMALLPEATD